jgi:hypothetical protein
MINNDITIVNFFFDTGRGEWSPDKGFPHYLHRTNDTYFERFGYMAQLENQIIVYTTDNFVDRIMELRKGKEDRTKVIPFQYHSMFSEEKHRIHSIQQNPKFISKIAPHQRINPEYWNPDYIQLMYLKSFFVNWAIERGLVENDYVAYLDFGYCRTQDKIPPSKKWSYDFGQDKFHLFGYKQYPKNKPIEDVIFNNDVYVFGAKQIGHKSLWKKFNQLIQSSFKDLIDNDLVDDDQTLLLMSYLKDPEFFQFNIIPDHQLGHDSFVLFNNYNDTV